MRPAETLFAGALLLAGAAAVAAAVPRADEPARAALGFHETRLESGARVVVVTPEAPGRRESGDADAPLDVVLALPFGWADDSSPPGSGLAELAARFAVVPGDGDPRWGCELLPTATLFAGRFTGGEFESALAALVERLRARECDEALHARALEACEAPQADAFARWREAAAPQSAEGLGPGRAAGRAAPTREELARFLAARCGSEGSLLVAVTARPAAALSLQMGRALETLPRARGVAPAFVREPEPRAPRRVRAPSGSDHGFAGVRLRWCDDPHGDRLALAQAFLEEAAGRAADKVEHDRLGGFVAFRGEAGAAGDLAGRVRRAVAALHDGSGAQPAFDEIAWARIAARIALDVAATQEQAPGALARRIALEGVLHGTPQGWLARHARIEAQGFAAARDALAHALAPEGVIEVVPDATTGLPP